MSVSLHPLPLFSPLLLSLLPFPNSSAHSFPGFSSSVTMLLSSYPYCVSVSLRQGEESPERRESKGKGRLKGYCPLILLFVSCSVWLQTFHCYILRVSASLPLQKHENASIVHYKDEIEVMKGRITELKNVEKQLKMRNNQIVELQEKITKLTEEVEVG